MRLIPPTAWPSLGRGTAKCDVVGVGVASVGAGLGGILLQSLSGLTVDKLANRVGYATAYHSVFVGYGIVALIGLSIVLFVIGPLLKDKSLEIYVKNDLFHPEILMALGVMGMAAEC
jgi:hypothetical protein